MKSIFARLKGYTQLYPSYPMQCHSRSAMYQNLGEGTVDFQSIFQGLTYLQVCSRYPLFCYRRMALSWGHTCEPLNKPQRPRMQPTIEPKDNSLHLPLSHCLSFNLVCEVKITFVELVNSNIAIFSSTCVPFSSWINGNGICRPIRPCSAGFRTEKHTQRAEMSPDATNFFLEDLVIESGFEFTLSGYFRGN
jgi:hypothetical protein